jgi:AraC-like DNA-binding protein
MNHQDNLALNWQRLTCAEESDQEGEGLAFVFPRGGAGQFVTKQGTHRLAAGDILVFHRGAGCKIMAQDNAAEFNFFIFSVFFEHLLPLFASKEIALLHAITEGLKTPKIHPVSSPLAAACHRLLDIIPPQINLDHRGQLIRIAATLLCEEFSEIMSQPGDASRPENQVTRIFQRLSAADLIKLSVDELAGRFNCSRRHLNRLFHQHFGVSVVALKMEMRLLKAISLLRDANVKITSVAEQCGFNHLGPFNTCFKRRFGTSPGNWRKSTLQTHARSDRDSQQTVNLPGGQREATPVMACMAGKIANGDVILEELKRRNLVFGFKTPEDHNGHALTEMRTRGNVSSRTETVGQPTLSE